MRGTTAFFVGGTVHTTGGVWVIEEVEDGVSWALPWDGELLEMDDFVAMHDLLDEFLSFFLIHTPDFTDLAVICFFESFIFGLEFLEVISEGFIFLGQVDITLLVTSLFFQEPFLNGSDQ